jgi:hypothetical protein
VADEAAKDAGPESRRPPRQGAGARWVVEAEVEGAWTVVARDLPKREALRIAAELPVRRVNPLSARARREPGPGTR